jgi:uridine kinase
MPAKIYLIGIAGPSGAGKTYLARRLAAALHAKVVALDRYYRDLSHLSFEERAAINFDAPQALEHELLIAQVARLRNAEAVQLPVYDFGSHTRAAATEILRPSDVLLVEGLFALHWPELRELLGTKVYVDLDDEICLARRQQRDIRERGRTPESVIEQYTATVAPMAQHYVRPTIAYADVVVCGDEPVQHGVTRVLAHYQQQIADSKLRTARP